MFKQDLCQKGGEVFTQIEKKGVTRNMLQEIRTLVQMLNEQRDTYYNRNFPTMSNKEYESLLSV